MATETYVLHDASGQPIGKVTLAEAHMHINCGGRIFERYGFAPYGIRYYELPSTAVIVSPANYEVAPKT